MNEHAEVDVLVVGAGATGLTLANELLRHGLTVRLVDEADAPSSGARAVTVHGRTLAALRDLGLADALIAKGQKLRGVTAWSSGSAIVRADFDELEADHPYVLAVAQGDAEAVLTDALTQRGGAVERATRLTALRQDGTGVTATLTRGEATLTARAAWLVGCDGAGSAVRRALDLPFAGPAREDRTLLADVKIDWDTRDDRVSAYFADDGLVACVPLPGGRWRLIATAPAGDERTEAPTLDEVQAVFARRTGAGAALRDLVGSERHRVVCRQVAQYRDDRALLAGAAAHTQGPALAAGLNAGVQDAHNLAWKLAQVHRGEARARLLDSYHDERHGAGQAALRGVDLATKVATLKGAPIKGVRDELARFLASFELVQQRVAREDAELTADYERSPIVREDHTSLLQARIGTAAGAETPTITSVRWFDSAISAGQRARDGRVTVAGEAGTRGLLDALDARTWSVVLFDGRSASAEGYQRFASIVSALAARYPDAVEALVVTPRASRPAEVPDGVRVLLDPDGELEKLYGAATECVYVLRPDRYVGYRAQPADEAKLLAYFRPILRPTGP